MSLEKIVLETESYLVEGKENERFFPFLELEFNEAVIYENDIPKYYISLPNDPKTTDGVQDWIINELEKNGHDLRKLIVTLGKSLNLNWDIFSSHIEKIVEESWKSESVELTVFNDRLIEKVKTRVKKL